MQIFENTKSQARNSKKENRQRIGHNCSNACGCVAYLDSLKVIAPTLLGRMTSLTSYSQDISWMNVNGQPTVKQSKCNYKDEKPRGRNKRN